MNPRASDDEEFVQAQKEAWKTEQQIVASMVQVDKDPQSSLLPPSSDDEFHLFDVLREDDIYTVDSDFTQDQPELYGGVDVSFPPPSPEGDRKEDDPNSNRHMPQSVAVYVIVDQETFQVVYRDYEFFDLTVPYIPTYLAFRETDPLERLVRHQMKARPDLMPRAILVDGNGILHPRNAGLACFLGTRVDLPTIGIGKSLLYEGGWTRENLATSLDTFLKNVHNAIFHVVDHNKSQQQRHLAAEMQRFPGLIVKRIVNYGESTENKSQASVIDGDVSTVHAGSHGHPLSTTVDNSTEEGGGEGTRMSLLQDLAPYCNGLAIPLTNRTVSRSERMTMTEGYDKYQEDDHAASFKRFPVLGVAMIGHGGKVGPITNSNKKKQKKKILVGATQPLFISVGHKLSLAKAAQITASLCQSKIPEPVRQADLYGRELIREQAATRKRQQQDVAQSPPKNEEE